MLKEALQKRDFAEDAQILAKAASIIRKDIFNPDAIKFEGSFPENCQETSLPSSLKTLISLIFNVVSLKSKISTSPKHALPLVRLLSTTLKKKSKESNTQTRHSLDREPPLPVYIGLNIHGLTRCKPRCKPIIQQLHELGISISYVRAIQLEEWIAEAMCERFDKDGVVSPACLRKGLFTVSALDKLDHNPSSTTSKSSFHGTGIILLQFPTENQPGESRPPVTIPPVAPRKHILPEAYTTVPAVALTNSTIFVQKCDIKPAKNCLDQAKEEEIKWVENSSQLLKKADLNKGDTIAWAAYHASQELPYHAYEALRLQSGPLVLMLSRTSPHHCSPAEFAWTKVGSAWVPVWLTVPELSKACRELIKCSCKGDCSSCKCGKAQLKCSPLCKCKCNLHSRSQNK